MWIKLSRAKRPLSSSDTSDDGPVPKRSNVSDARLQKMDELNSSEKPGKQVHQGTPEQDMTHTIILPANLFSASKGSLLLVCRVLENAFDYAHSVLIS